MPIPVFLSERVSQMENDEPVSLGEFIDRAVRDHAAQFDGGIATGFACIVERLDDSGEPCLTIVTPHGQMTWRTLGLVGYMMEWFKDDAHLEMQAWAAQSGEDE